jgi:hypothetical protein
MTTNLSGRGVAGILPSTSAQDVGGIRRGLGSKITWAHSRAMMAQISALAAAAVAKRPVLRAPLFGNVIARFREHPPFRRAPRGVVFGS